MGYVWLASCGNTGRVCDEALGIVECSCYKI